MNFNPFKIYRIHFLWFICWVPIGAFDTTINNYVVPEGCTELPLLFESFFIQDQHLLVVISESPKFERN